MGPDRARDVRSGIHSWVGRSLEGIDRVLGLARGAAGERGKVASRKEDFFVRGAVPHACVHVRAFVCGGLSGEMT